MILWMYHESNTIGAEEETEENGFSELDIRNLELTVKQNEKQCYFVAWMEFKRARHFSKCYTTTIQ